MPATGESVVIDVTRPRRRNRLGLLVLGLLTQLATAAVLLALYLARRPGDLEPLGFMVLLGPRQAFLVPFLFLIPWAIRRRAGWLLAEQVLAVALCAGPLMGLNCSGLFHPNRHLEAVADRSVRIMSYNIGPNGFEIERLVDYLNKEKIDILLVQEDTDVWKLRARLAAEKGWYFDRHSSIFSRLPIIAESEELTDEVGGHRLYAGRLALVRVKRGELDFLVGSTHGPSLRGAFYNLAVNTDVDQLRQALGWQKRQLMRITMMMDKNDALPLVVGGDFNVPPGSVFSAPLEKRFQDVFAEIGFGYGYTYPTDFPSIRLDKFYLSRGWRPLSCYVAPDFGSDHRPIFAEIQLMESAGKVNRQDVAE